MKYLLFFLFLLAPSAWGQLTHSLEVSKNLEQTEVEIVKKELLFEACMKSIEKFSSEMGYDASEFNQKLHDAFKTYFENLKETKIAERYGSNYKETLSAEDKAAFLAGLEKEANQEFIKFSEVLNIVRSFSINNLVQDKTVWKALVQVDLDRVKLERLVRKTLKAESKKSARLILLVDINLQNFDWKELGLEQEQSFAEPLAESWLKWLSENVTSNFEAIICDKSCRNYYVNWLESPREDMQSKLASDYSGDLWLSINFHLRRFHFSPTLQESGFEWEGRVVLQDINSKRLIKSYTLSASSKSFSHLDPKEMNSQLASLMYRSPLGALTQVSKEVKEHMPYNRVSNLVIKGHANLGEALKVVDTLKTRGSSLGLDLVINFFSRDELHLLGYYQGEEKAFSDVLSGLKEIKFPHGYSLVNEFTGTQHVLKLVQE